MLNDGCRATQMLSSFCKAQTLISLRQVPVAATLSPILWRLNNPDRFDMYSVGVLLLQMVFPPLRSDNNLVRPFAPVFFCVFFSLHL